MKNEKIVHYIVMLGLPKMVSLSSLFLFLHIIVLSIMFIICGLQNHEHHEEYRYYSCEDALSFPKTEVGNSDFNVSCIPLLSEVLVRMRQMNPSAVC